MKVLLLMLTTCLVFATSGCEEGQGFDPSLFGSDPGVIGFDTHSGQPIYRSKDINPMPTCGVPDYVRIP